MKYQLFTISTGAEIHDVPLTERFPCSLQPGFLLVFSLTNNQLGRSELRKQDNNIKQLVPLLSFFQTCTF